ncbi:SGNH/GDSL hydrolase family protein [Streptomyces sp. NPDC091383]|uniref:SGNH/GDSL hydrolase family protein n=1 Tax=Streptomyces sp. NPDC091383 TaxID=3365996 RepID=UPI0038169DA0
MLRFMPVGDSMTIGSAGEHTWRHRLWQLLRGTYDPAVTLVGPRETLYDKETGAPTSLAYADPDPDFPRAHLAGWGEGWLHMAPLIGDAIRTCRPDVLLVSLGLIDLGFYTNAEQTAENVRAFVGAARAADPGVRMVLLPVIPNVRAESDAPFADQVALFNVLLAKAVADLDEPRSPLLLASPPRSYDIHTDTYDGTHPNASGEQRIAEAFAGAMRQAWGIGRACVTRTA